jgi:dienelactone hydrolase
MDGLMTSYDRNRWVSAVGVLLAVFFLGGCYGTLQLAESDAPTVLARQVLEGASPSSEGDFKVLTLTYGSGTDKNREEYREGVAFRTDSVDASKLISLGGQADERNGYWGFTPKGFPLNARVWFPDGEGPFPLVLVVHGNHDPKDFSDPGYDYLGELLASRGYILASIDMNFVNGGIRQENDSRGWLLLKHVQAFEGFNADEANPFFGKVDMSNVALMGHSRGGEAVGHAAAFNRLTHYPDDASLRFDFNFDIKSIVAIAPVDGQYLPTDRFVPLENVSYMVFHGSHDGDVTSFHGTRLYNRLRFTDGEERLKAAIYVYRANHGQWNSVWRNKDNGPRSARRLDLRGLLETEEQMEFARIYISAFLDYTLKGERGSLPLFRDHRVAGDWLPKTMYITRFQDSSYRALAEFDEDIDVTTGTAVGVHLEGDSLSTWRERTLNLRSSNRPTTSSSQQSQAVWLGWNNKVSGSDEPGPTAQFRVVLPDTLGRAWQLDDSASLELSLTAIEATPGPRKAAERENEELRAKGEAEGEAEGDAENEDPDEDAEKSPIDLSVQLVDASGRTASVPLSDYGPVRRPLETHVMRRSDQEERRFANLFELLLQSYSIPFGDFLEVTPDLDVRSLSEIRLVFDRAEAGTVVVDDIGIAFLDPAYTAARIERSGN